MKVPAVIALFAVTSISSTASAQAARRAVVASPTDIRHRNHRRRHPSTVTGSSSPPDTHPLRDRVIVLGKNAGRSARCASRRRPDRPPAPRSRRVRQWEGHHVPVDKWLTSRRPNARIDFGQAHRIDRIAVTTSTYAAGTYAVYGSWSVTSSGELVAIRSECSWRAPGDAMCISGARRHGSSHGSHLPSARRGLRQEGPGIG
jgi:hypothetical protein